MSSLSSSSQSANRENVIRLVASVLVFGTLVIADEDHDHDHDHPESAVVEPDPKERIHSLEVAYEIHRDGTVTLAQEFRLGVAGVAIKRGPILNYLTAFRGPGGLILDSELEILEVLRDGHPEPFRLERSDGFVTLLIGSADQPLEHRAHDYRIRGRMEADWIRGEGEFFTVFDLVGSLPTLPLDVVVAKVTFPEGVPVSRYTPALTGVAPGELRHGPAYEAGFSDRVLIVRSTAPLQRDRSFFLNLTWPSEGFAIRSQWLKIMRQHPRLPLAGFSALLLIWALVTLVNRLLRRSHKEN